MSDAPKESACLAHHAPAREGRVLSVKIAEVSDMAMIDLRVRSADVGGEVMAALEKAVGVSLSMGERRAVSSVGGGSVRRVLWLSPDQRLLTLPMTDRVSVLAAMRSAVAGCHAMVTDVSDARVVFRLEGDGVREVLMKGMAADLLKGGFGAGDVRRGLMAEMGSLVDCIGESPDIFDVYVFRSYGAHMWDWLARAADPDSVVKLFRRG